MRVVHLREQGVELRAEGQRLLVAAGGVVVQEIRLPLLDRLVIHGAVHISAGALARLLASGADVVFLSAKGEYRGRLEVPMAVPVELRLRQALTVADPARRAAFARVIVRNKLHGQLRVLRVLRVPIPQEWSTAARTLRVAASPNEVAGCEGLATRAYFAALRPALGAGRGWTRRRRPPPDPLNALLSYLYALTQPIVHRAALTAGLDPYLGLLHAPGRGRPSLTLDLLEELRAPYCDLLAVRLRRALGPGGWWEESGGAVRLSPAARAAAIRAVEERLLRRTFYRPAGRALPWHEVIERQAKALARAIREGKPEVFRPIATAERRGRRGGEQ